MGCSKLWINKKHKWKRNKNKSDVQKHNRIGKNWVFTKVLLKTSTSTITQEESSSVIYRIETPISFSRNIRLSILERNYKPIRNKNLYLSHFPDPPWLLRFTNDFSVLFAETKSRKGGEPSRHFRSWERTRSWRRLNWPKSNHKIDENRRMKSGTEGIAYRRHTRQDRVLEVGGEEGRGELKTRAFPSLLLCTSRRTRRVVVTPTKFLPSHVAVPQWFSPKASDHRMSKPPV